MEPENVKEELKKQITEYQKLKMIKDSEEFQDYFKLLIKTVAEKMIWAFTTGKDGDNIQDWSDFCKVRGEIIARLHPIQEVASSEAMVQYLTNQLEEYYLKQS